MLTTLTHIDYYRVCYSTHTTHATNLLPMGVDVVEGRGLEGRPSWAPWLGVELTAGIEQRLLICYGVYVCVSVCVYINSMLIST